ncbi:hypothetical protein CRUP_014697 [Coryphaenoides rupestris]|nr:hypothetical protein CRUP_014697 [Coryphaenoides rupestris]
MAAAARPGMSPPRRRTGATSASGPRVHLSPRSAPSLPPGAYLPSPEPHFISAYDIGLFTFFFLRENAVEHDCGKTVVLPGGRASQRTTSAPLPAGRTRGPRSMKARLNCSRFGRDPFYYNELQSTFYCRSKTSSTASSPPTCELWEGGEGEQNDGQATEEGMRDRGRGYKGRETEPVPDCDADAPEKMLRAPSITNKRTDRNPRQRESV